MSDTAASYKNTLIPQSIGPMPGAGTERPTDDYGTYLAALQAGVKPGDPKIKDTEGRLSLAQQQQAVAAAQASKTPTISSQPRAAGVENPMFYPKAQNGPVNQIGGVENPMYYPNQSGGVSPGQAAASVSSAPSSANVAPQSPAPVNASPTLAKKVADAWDYMRSNSGPGGKINWADLLVKGLGGIGDAIGASKLAYAGIQSPTRLQQEYKMRLASQQQGNQQQAATTAALQKINPQTDAAIRQAIATQDNARINEIAAYLGMTPDAIKRIYAGTKANVLSEQMNPRNLGTPEQAADNITGNAPQGE